MQKLILAGICLHNVSEWLRDWSNNVFDHIPELAHNLDEATAATNFHCMV